MQRFVDAFFGVKQQGFLLLCETRDIAIEYGAEQPFFIGEFRIQCRCFGTGRFNQVRERRRFVTVLPE